MLLYLGDTLIETDNMDFIRITEHDPGAPNQGISSKRSLVIKPRNEPMQAIHDDEVVNAFAFTMELGAKLGITNVMEYWAERHELGPARARQKERSKLILKLQEEQEDQAIQQALLGQIQGPQPEEQAPKVQAPPRSIPTTGGPGNLLIVPGKGDKDVS